MTKLGLCRTTQIHEKGSASCRLLAGLASLATATALVSAEPALAQAQSQDDENIQDAIIVTATRSSLPTNALPLTIDVIGGDEFIDQTAISGSVVDAVAALTPSFSPTRQKLSGFGETLRGRSPLFAINGIPQSTPLRDGSRDGYTIDPFFIDRVELIFGSNALQGIGATGGIVNQVTAGAPTTDGFSGRLLSQLTIDGDASSAGFGWKTAGLVSWRQGALDATIGAAYEDRGIYRDGRGNPVGVDGAQGEVQDSQSISLFGRFGLALSPSARIELMLSQFDLDGRGDYVLVSGNRTAGIPASARLGEQGGIAPNNRTQTASLTLTDDDLAGGTLNAQVFFNRSRDTFGGSTEALFQDPAFPPFGTLFEQSQNRSRKYGGKISYERVVPGLEALTAIVGFDALKDLTVQKLIVTDRAWVPPTDYRGLAPFAQFNLKLLDGALRLAGGARYENVQITVPDYQTLFSYGARRVTGGSPKFTDVLVNGGVIVEPTQGVRAYASYAEGYTVPDVGRITRAIREENIRIDDFLDIEPVVSNNRELGIEVKQGPIDASAAYFWSSSTRGQFLIANSDGIFEVQRQRVEIEGLEVNIATDTPVNGLRLNVGYSHLSGRTDTNADNVVDRDLDGPNIAPDRVNLAALFARGPVSARLQHSVYLSRRFAGGDPRNDFGGYALTDASVRLSTGLGAVSLAASNIFDKFYVSYDSDTSQPTNNNRFFAGRGRTLTLGWDYRF